MPMPELPEITLHFNPEQEPATGAEIIAGTTRLVSRRDDEAGNVTGTRTRNQQIEALAQLAAQAERAKLEANMSILDKTKALFGYEAPLPDVQALASIYTKEVAGFDYPKTGPGGMKMATKVLSDPSEVAAFNDMLRQSLRAKAFFLRIPQELTAEQIEKGEVSEWKAEVQIRGKVREDVNVSRDISDKASVTETTSEKFTVAENNSAPLYKSRAEDVGLVLIKNAASILEVPEDPNLIRGYLGLIRTLKQYEADNIVRNNKLRIKLTPEDLDRPQVDQFEQRLKQNLTPSAAVTFSSGSAKSSASTKAAVPEETDIIALTKHLKIELTESPTLVFSTADGEAKYAAEILSVKVQGQSKPLNAYELEEDDVVESLTFKTAEGQATLMPVTNRSKWYEACTFLGEDQGDYSVFTYAPNDDASVEAYKWKATIMLPDNTTEYEVVGKTSDSIIYKDAQHNETTIKFIEMHPEEQRWLNAATIPPRSEVGLR